MEKIDYKHEAGRYLVQKYIEDTITIYEVLRETLQCLAPGFALPPFEDFCENGNGCQMGGEVEIGSYALTFPIDNPPTPKVLLDALNERFAQLDEDEVWIVAHSAMAIEGLDLTFYASAYPESLEYLETHSLDEYMEYERGVTKKRLDNFTDNLKSGLLSPLPYPGEEDNI